MPGALRILLLLRSLDIGGAERQAVLLARKLAERGHAVTVATFYGGGALEAELAGAGVSLAVLGKRGRGDVLGFGARLASFVRDVQPDVLYSFLPVPNLLSLIAPRRARRPRRIWGIRASDMDMRRYDWLSALTHALEPAFAGLADAVVANSEVGAAAAIARGVPRERIHVVRNGVDLERFRPDAAARDHAREAWGIEADELVVGHMARFDPMKDHATFVDAMALAIRKRPNLSAVIATTASGQDRATLEALVGRAGLNGRVRVIDGAAADASQIMNGFDVFCSSSAYGEGWSNVLCEAFATGLLCAATDVGDAHAIIGNAGAVCAPCDPAGLSDALLNVAERRAASPGATVLEARARAALFTPQAMTDATERIMIDLTR